MESAGNEKTRENFAFPEKGPVPQIPSVHGRPGRGGQAPIVRRADERRNAFVRKILGRYLLQALVTLVGISFIMFSITMLGTEDLARQLISGAEDVVVSQAEIDAVTKELGLDQPFSCSSGIGSLPRRRAIWDFLHGAETGHR